MKKHLWECKHPYYCTEGNYFSSQHTYQTIWPFASWADFIEEMGNADKDYNMLFRWDWEEPTEDNEGEELPTGDVDINERNGKLKLYFMIQRKGFHLTSIVDVCRADEEAVIEYLKPKLEHLKSLWAPFNE